VAVSVTTVPTSYASTQSEGHAIPATGSVHGETERGDERGRDRGGRGDRNGAGSRSRASPSGPPKEGGACLHVGRQDDHRPEVVVRGAVDTAIDA
jgi:hypothetical protein